MAELVLECSFEVLIVMGDPAKKAFLSVLERRGGGRHVGTVKYAFGKESRAIEWGDTTIFTQRHPQNLLPSWSGAQVARAYARSYDELSDVVNAKLGYSDLAASTRCYDLVVSLGGDTDAKRGRDDPIIMVRNLHNEEMDSARECKWEALPAIVKEHLAAEGVYTQEGWLAKEWRPSTQAALDKPPFSPCKFYLSCMGTCRRADERVIDVDGMTAHVTLLLWH
jgi:hypothetical protein